MAKAEKFERKIEQGLEKTSFFDYVQLVDKQYKDTVFWLMEHSKNETLDTISRWTLGWRVEIQQRIADRLQAESSKV